MNEQEAIRRMQRGDINGLARLVEEHQLRAVRTAMLITRDQALAEDVVQSTFIRVYEKIHQFDASRPFAPWFMRAVVHAALGAVRQRERITPLNIEQLWDSLHDAGNPQEALEQAQQIEQVRDALDQLSAEQRAVVVMRYYLDMSDSEIAEALKTPAGTIKWRLHEARKRLRGLLRVVMNPGKEWGVENG